MALLCTNSLFLSATAGVYIAIFYLATSHTTTGRRFARQLWRGLFRLYSKWGF